MKNILYTFVITAAVAFTSSCNKEKTAIDDAQDANEEVIDAQKSRVDANAENSIDQVEEDAEKAKADIKAKQDAMNAELDAEKIRLEAEAKAAKEKLDAEQR